MVIDQLLRESLEFKKQKETVTLALAHQDAFNIVTVIILQLLNDKLSDVYREAMLESIVMQLTPHFDQEVVDKVYETWEHILANVK